MVDSMKKATNTSIEAAYIVWYMIITILYIFVFTPSLVGEMQSCKDEELQKGKKGSEGSPPPTLVVWKDGKKRERNEQIKYIILPVWSEDEIENSHTFLKRPSLPPPICPFWKDFGGPGAFASCSFPFPFHSFLLPNGGIYSPFSFLSKPFPTLLQSLQIKIVLRF